MSKLSGPTSVSVLTSDKYCKKIMLLGDEHFSLDNICKDSHITLLKYLDKMFSYYYKKYVSSYQGKSFIPGKNIK